MRHRKTGYKLGRTASHRKAMLRNMATSVFEYESIKTTETKAKAVKPLVEKLITLAKRGDMHARRQALAILTKKSVTHKLFTEIRERYMERTGGYTSIVRIGPRIGDAAEMAVLELIKPDERGKKAKKRTRRRRSGGKKKGAEAAEAQAPKKEEKPAETEEAPKAEAAAETEAPVEETAPAAEAPEAAEAEVAAAEEPADEAPAEEAAEAAPEGEEKTE